MRDLDASLLSQAPSFSAYESSLLGPNRFYYQIASQIKDAAVLSNCPDPAVRRGWVQRILDHDGLELGGNTGDSRKSYATAKGFPGGRPGLGSQDAKAARRGNLEVGNREEPHAVQVG